MQYQLVYDLGAEGYQRWWLYGVSVGLSALLAFCILIPEPLQRISGRIFSPPILWAALLLNLGWSGISFVHSYGAYRTLIGDVRAGRVSFLEGPVTQYEPAKPGMGASDDESFVVAGKRFVYSGSAGLGFHETHVYGGPIKEGLNVRIAYVSRDGRDVITRLEIGKQ